ncbi:putative retrotransposon Copia-like protein [Arabidopsis thaliana]
MSSNSPDPAPVVPIRSISEIDAVDSPHSPFFLHSADHPGLTLVADRLDGTNYTQWSSAMKISLDAKNKIAFIDGSLPRPAEGTPLSRIWSRCNSMVKS